MLLKKLKYKFRDYFAFTPSEARGAWVLLFLITLLLVIPPFYKRILQKKYTQQEFAKDQVSLDSLMYQLEQNYQVQKINREVNEKVILKLQPFNPNYADKNTMHSLGFQPWIADRIIKYREAGGKFVIKKDLLRIYGISEEVYQQVYDYIDLPEEIEPEIHSVNFISNQDESKEYKRISKPEKININLADTALLKQLSGIGSVFAARIIKYRNLLGGFVDTTQYAEIYGLSPEVILCLQTQTVISNNEVVQKINLNTADINTLAAHPYISFKVAKAIVKHRENYGVYTKIEDVKEVYLMDEVLFAKIALYIVI